MTQAEIIKLLFEITMAAYFNIKLNNPNGFLAQKLGGTGKVEVAITKNNFKDLITFKRGEKYYSCHAVNGTFYVKIPLPEGYGSDSTVFNIELDGIARQAIVSADSKTGIITAKLENLGLCVICNGFNAEGEKTKTKSDGNIEKIILYVLIGAAVLVSVAIALVMIIITKRRLRK